ncbi:hypothetical protein [Xylanimonas sp. McL0601]|uniref:hypothetical protein n=1 Tax=Xylanimonas sp. McL0601 TaxID=3414739 RepID=UPI003CF4C762
MTVTSRPDVPEVVPAPPAHRRPRRAIWVAGLLVLVLVAAGIVIVQQQAADPRTDVRAGTTAVSAERLAATYGIDVDLVAVTAAGGLVEFRYQVADPDKAETMIHDTELLPTIVVEGTGATLVVSTPHHHTAPLQLGGTYFFLLANAHNAIRRGALLTLVIGDLRVEHIVAQG